jgi:ABC-2 type transport system permease protein
VKALYIGVVVVVVVTLRLLMYRARRKRRATEGQAPGTTHDGVAKSPLPRSTRAPRWRAVGQPLGTVGIIAMREITERVRGRILRVGTLLILGVVAAAIIIPTLHSSSGGLTAQTVGIVGSLSPQTEQVVGSAAKQDQDSVRFVREPSIAAAKAALRSGRLDFAVADADLVLLNQPATSSSSPADPTLVQDVAQYLGVVKAYEAAGLTRAQAAQVDQAKAVPVHTLQPGTKTKSKAVSIIGLVLLFFMLTQYCTWILIGVMQEKSSRVVEVLLATVRPIQLLGGKVLGIGLVALGQATLVLGFALALGEAVGSNLLHGAEPVALLAELLWLVLGYAFYCWVYAAAGSTAERQDQVQTLVLPLSIPVLVGYVFSITVASSGKPDLLFKVLAYVPLTAPFCMSVLVSLSQVTWWEFVLSVLISLAATVGMAMFAARIYRRAVLRTGARVKVRELLAGPAR